MIHTNRIRASRRLSEAGHRALSTAVVLLTTTGILWLCAGCGAHRAITSSTIANRSSPSKAAQVYGGPAPLLVLFTRVVGFDPLASQLVVDQNGAAAATITLGGVGGQKKQEFRLTGWRLRRLRHLLLDTHLRDANCCENPGYYTYRVVTRGHSWELYQRGLPRTLRPLIRYLNAIMAAHLSYS
jgi:hypothetical protein